MAVLLLTVGTGDSRRIEESLYAPLLRSIGEGTWSRVVLLPSLTSAGHAEEIRRRVGGAVEVRPLERADDENDADRCFAHFDRTIRNLIRRGEAARDMAADFTRGTKAMSAALVLAAVRHGLPRLRYIEGERDELGQVVAGSERLRAIRPDEVMLSRRLDLARELFRQGDFAAVERLLPDPRAPLSRGLLPLALVPEIELARALARLQAAWDRLDYVGAAALVPQLPAETGSPWEVFRPGGESVAWLRALASPPPSDDHAAMARHLRVLVADIWANGRRRARDHQFEDAMVRAYRVLEMLGQARLFDHGYDSAALPPDDGAIAAFQAALLKKKRHPLSERKGLLQASRYQVTEILRHLGDGFGERLAQAARGPFDEKMRNNSILIHGYSSMSPSDHEAVQAIFVDLRRLLIADDPSAEDRLRIASLADFSGDPAG